MHERSRNSSSPKLPEEDLDEPRAHRPPPGLALDPPDAPLPEHPPEIPSDRLDQDALRVIARLRHMRHKAYFVGGCVRDLLLGVTPKDFDVATDAHPGEVRAIFRNCRLIGRRFRLAHVYFRGGKAIEVATFRKNPTDVAEDVGEDDADLLITRDNVFGTAEEDAVRRDFTVNGLFYDVATGEVIDYVGGRADLEMHRIATIGDPEIRMREDPVRALRAVRFAARLGFTIAPDTFEAMRRHAGELARCAPARVLEETFKLLRCGGSARAFELLRACGALPVVLPALAGALDGWDETRRRAFFAHLAALDRLIRSREEVSEAVLLGALLMHLGANPETGARPDAEALLASLVQTSRLPRKVAERTRLALHAQRHLGDGAKKKRRRGRGPGGQLYFQDALQLLRITVEATGGDLAVLERWTADAGHQEPHADEQPGDEGHGHGGGRGHAGERPARAAGNDRRGRHHVRGEAERREAGPGVEGAKVERAHVGASHAAEVEVVAVDVDEDAAEDASEDAVEAVVATREAGGPVIREVAAEPEPGEAGEGGPGKRRRRRRGGRRRRRRGAGAGPSGPQPPPAAAGGEG